MNFKGNNEISFENMDFYKKTYRYVYDNLSKMPKSEEKDNIAENLTLLYIYSCTEFDIEKIQEVLNNFEGVKYVDKFGNNWSGCYYPGKKEGDSTYIQIKNDYKEKIDVLTHETIHLGSNSTVDGIHTNGLNKKFPMIDEIMTEFYSNRVINLKNNLHPANTYKTDEFYQKTFRDSQYFVKSESLGYCTIEGFAPVLDSLLHYEILKDKLNNSNELAPYEDIMKKLNFYIDKTYLSPNDENYDNVVSTLGDLCEYAFIYKSKNDYNYRPEKPQELLLKDYIPVRQSLSEYGVCDKQKELIERLDNLVLDLILPTEVKNDIDIRHNGIYAFKNMSENNFASLDFFERTTGQHLPDYTFNVERKNEFISKRNSLEGIMNCPNDLLIKYVNNESDAYTKLAMKTKLGLTNENNVFETYRVLKSGEHIDVDGRNISYLLATTPRISSNYMGVIMQELCCNEDESTTLKNLNDTIFKKDNFGKDSFDYALEKGNYLYAASILAALGTYNNNPEFNKYVQNVFKEKKELIEKNVDCFFAALEYSSKSNSEDAFFVADDFEKNLKNLEVIDFSNVKNSKNNNFMGYIVKNNFTMHVFGDDSCVNGLRDYSSLNEQAILAKLLQNGYSLSKEKEYGETLFETLISQKDKSGLLQSQAGYLLLQTIKSNSSKEEWNSYLESIPPQIISKNMGAFGFNLFEDKINGRNLFRIAIEDDNIDVFKDIRESLQKAGVIETAIDSSIKNDSKKVFKELMIDIGNTKGRDSFRKYAINSLENGSTDIFRELISTKPEVVFKKNREGQSLFDIYAKFAINSDKELSELVNINSNSMNNDYIEEMVSKYNKNSEISKILIKTIKERGDRTVDIDSPLFKDIMKISTIKEDFKKELDNYKEVAENKTFKEKFEDFFEIG